MEETQTQQVQPEQKPEAQPKAEAKEDIVSRVSKVPPETAKETQPAPSDGFDRKKYDEMVQGLAPELRAQVKAYESEIMSGANKKFMEAAELRKEADSLRQAGWSQERIHQLLKDPEFVKEAQRFTAQSGSPQSQITEEEWSALTAEERQELKLQQQRVQALANEMNAIKTQALHEKLKSRYANFDAETVGKFKNDLISGRYQATDEDIWKVYDYENAINRAYALGLQDKQLNLTEKQNASSIDGLSVTAKDEVPARMEKESVPEYYKRLAQRRLKMMQK